MSSGDQIELQGRELQLQPATAQTLALVLHELITNSVKYGALSALSGRLRVQWDVQADELQLLWEERGGPPVNKPASRGFGTRSVIASIESQLGGRADFDWHPAGLVCRLSVPIAEEKTRPASSLQRSLAAGGSSAEPALRTAGV